MLLRTLAILSALASPALADAACPIMYGGRHIAKNDGGSLYVGDPRAGMLVAPDKQAHNWSDTNVWRISRPVPLTLVCSYDGGQRVAYAIPPGAASQCVQALATGAFVCR